MNNSDMDVLVHIFWVIPTSELLDIFGVLITGNSVYMPLVVFHFGTFCYGEFQVHLKTE